MYMWKCTGFSVREKRFKCLCLHITFNYLIELTHARPSFRKCSSSVQTCFSAIVTICCLLVVFCFSVHFWILVYIKRSNANYVIWNLGMLDLCLIKLDRRSTNQIVMSNCEMLQTQLCKLRNVRVSIADFFLRLKSSANYVM